MVNFCDNLEKIIGHVSQCSLVDEHIVMTNYRGLCKPSIEYSADGNVNLDSCTSNVPQDRFGRER